MNKFFTYFGKNLAFMSIGAFIMFGTAGVLTVISNLLLAMFGPWVGLGAVVLMVILFLSAVVTVFDMAIRK